MTRLVSALLVAVLGPALAQAAPRKAGMLDRFRAEWEGFEVESYVMMKEMGQALQDMQDQASITRRDDDSAAQAWAKEKVGDELLDWAADINPAVKPIKAMSDFATDKTQAWLDWRFRSKVNRVYLEYRKALAETGDVKQAVERANRWIDESLESAGARLDAKALEAIKANRGFVLAQVIRVDRQFHPDRYEGKDIKAALGKGAKKPGVDPNEPHAREFNALPEKSRQALLDCLCECGTNAVPGAVATWYKPEPHDGSPNCWAAKDGPCVNQGFGCWRTKLGTGTCADGCYRRYQVKGIPASLAR